MGLFSRRRKRKNALRTPDNYTHERMLSDHAASAALFVATMPDAHVTVDEQEDETAQTEPENDYSESGYDSEATSDYNSTNRSDYSTSYGTDTSGYGSSYDSGSDSGGSYDSGSY